MTGFKIKQFDSSVDLSRLEWWDVVIIGADPAGLTAAHRALTTRIVESKNSPGGEPHFLYSDKRTVNVPGFPDGVTGQDLSDRTWQQARHAHAQFGFNEELTAIEDSDRSIDGNCLKPVVTSQSSCLCRKVVLTCRLLHYPSRLSVLDGLESDCFH